MSGPKAIEVTLAPLWQARRSNRTLVEQWLAEYTRLESQLLSLNVRCEELKEPQLTKPKSPEMLRVDLEQHFSPGADGLSAVNELLDLKRQLEQRIHDGEIRVRRAIADLQQRFRQNVQRREILQNEVATLHSWAANVLPKSCSPTDRAQFDALWKKALGQLKEPARVEFALNRESIGRLQEAEAVVAQSIRAVRDTRRRLDEELDNIHRRSVRTAIGVSAIPQRLSDYIEANPESSLPEERDEKWTKKLDSLLAETAALHDADCWAGIMQRAATVRRESSDERRRMLYEALVLECDMRLRRLKELKGWQAEVHRLIDSAAPFRGTAVDAVIEELEGMECSGRLQDLASITKRLEDAKAAAQKQTAREEKRQAILQVLEDLGYEVIEGMKSAFAQAGSVLVQKGGQSEYAVEMVTDKDLSLLQTAVVRRADGSEVTQQQLLRDREQEEAWCSDHGNIRQKLAERGFNTEFKLQIPAGTYPVKIVQSGQRETHRQSRQRRQAGGL